MEKASEAMKQIHGKLTVEKVDETMYVLCLILIPLGTTIILTLYREKLREQNALSDEIVEAMNSVAVGNQPDEEELEDELERMQQEQLDEQMTRTGTVPVSDAVHKLPAAANGPRKLFSFAHHIRGTSQPLGKPKLTWCFSQGQGSGGGGRRRRGGASEIASRDGHVDSRRNRNPGLSWPWPTTHVLPFSHSYEAFLAVLRRDTSFVCLGLVCIWIDGGSLLALNIWSCQGGD